jgi:hypothetical protein
VVGSLLGACGRAVTADSKLAPLPDAHGGGANSGRSTSAAGMDAGGRGTSIKNCTRVTSLPARGAPCTGDAGTDEGASICDNRGDRCVCVGGSWLCSTGCSRSKPPVPGTACEEGSACTYPGTGVTCACAGSSWTCIGGEGCPADAPMTGNVCEKATGSACDYPGEPHFACACLAAGSQSRWACITLARCPPTEPAFPAICDRGPALCTYGNTRCACLRSGGPWLCV